MNDLDLLVAGAVVTFTAVAGAYVAIRHRANEAPVDNYRTLPQRPAPAPRAHSQGAQAEPPSMKVN
jgi:hypothetical protein